jgi:hypothetical protein
MGTQFYYLTFTPKTNTLIISKPQKTAPESTFSSLLLQPVNHSPNPYPHSTPSHSSPCGNPK